jgi:hypothetical protein
MLASVVFCGAQVCGQRCPHFIGHEVKDMIKRKQNLVMQFIVGAGSPVTWTAFFIIALWLWS